MLHLIYNLIWLGVVGGAGWWLNNGWRWYQQNMVGTRH